MPNLFLAETLVYPFERKCKKRGNLFTGNLCTTVNPNTTYYTQYYYFSVYLKKKNGLNFCISSFAIRKTALDYESFLHNFFSLPWALAIWPDHVSATLAENYHWQTARFETFDEGHFGYIFHMHIRTGEKGDNIFLPHH